MRDRAVCHRGEPAWGGRLALVRSPHVALSRMGTGSQRSACAARGESRDVHSAGLATVTAPGAADAVIFGREGLDRLVEVLIADGYHVIGPTVRDSAIVLDRL